jgi:hypothetical protein
MDPFNGNGTTKLYRLKEKWRKLRAQLVKRLFYKNIRGYFIKILLRRFIKEEIGEGHICFLERWPWLFKRLFSSHER